ncbi:MAG TPA: four helix bundle protein [Gemmatimonadaceae bacterium]|nr:four helix bundle protein [Gemmatimonadaceae bacterium]
MAHHLPVSADESHDPLSRMRAYQLATELIPDCFDDATRVHKHPVTKNNAPQLYSAVCSIESNIAEAYSRSSGKERATRFEYALGSVRESMSLYNSSRPVLGEQIVKDRRDRLEEIRRMLLAIIPRERGRTMK